MTGFYRRLLEVIVRFLPFAVAFLRDHRRFIVFGPPRRLPEEAHRRRAERLTETMIDLGATFIKVGQVLSTRPDIIPPIYAEALSSLQDEIPAELAGEPSEIVVEELGETIDAETIEPVAGGSLAYVYTAELADDSSIEFDPRGDRIALKVRRRGLRDRIELDLRVIRRLIPLVTPVAEEHHLYSLRNLADDFERVILDEIDFEREAEMMRRIDENFEDDGRIRIPGVDLERSNERIVVMEYVEGRKITDDDIEAAGVDRTELAERIAEVYLTMGLVHGTFHADPHPGNLAIDEAGRLVLYDFGMSERLSVETQERIVDLYRSLARRDVDGLIDALIALDVLEPSVDRNRVRRVIRLAMENLEGRADVTWRAIVTELFTELRDVPFRIPPNVMLLVRVGTVAEGVCRQLDPEFDFVAAVRTLLVEEGLFERELRALAGEIEADLRRSLPVAARLPARLDRLLESLQRGEVVVGTKPTTEPERASIGYAIVAGSLFVAAAILTLRPGPYEFLALGAGIVALFFFARSR